MISLCLRVSETNNDLATEARVNRMLTWIDLYELLIKEFLDGGSSGTFKGNS